LAHLLLIFGWNEFSISQRSGIIKNISNMMNLGLLDILTAQQVEKPDTGRNGDNSPSARYAESDRNFKDYVDNDKKPDADYRINSKKNDNDVNYDENALLAFINNNIDTKKLPSGISNDDIINILKSLKSQNIDLGKIDFSDDTSLGRLIGNLKNSGTNNTLLQQSGNKQNLGNHIPEGLLSLQEAEGLNTQITPVADIMGNLGKAVSSMSNEIANAGLQSSAKAQITALNNIEISGDTPEINSNLLQSQQTNTQSLSGIANVSEGSVAKVAEDVIQTAKTIAEEPQVQQTDIRSDQVKSLLNINPEDKKADNNRQENLNINNFTSKNADILKSLMSGDLQNTQELTKNLQNQLDNQKIASNKLAQNPANTQASGIQNNLSNNNSNGFQNSSDSFNPSSVQNSSDTPVNSGEFTKFQKYVDTVSNNIKNMGALKADKANDVMAQIKFGISSLGSKGESKITIQLHPKELGSVDVRIETGHDGKTKVAIMAEKIDTLNLLQKESGSLKGLLQDALQTQSGDLSFSFHEQSDEKWKEIIKDAFGKSYAQNNEDAEEKGIEDIAQIYNRSFVMKDGLDIRV